MSTKYEVVERPQLLINGYDVFCEDMDSIISHARMVRSAAPELLVEDAIILGIARVARYSAGRWLDELKTFDLHDVAEVIAHNFYEREVEA